MLSVDVARFRAETLREIRTFFDERGYLEVDTPAMARSLIPEAHIEVFRTELVDPYASDAGAGGAGAGGGAARESRARYLVPSPEIWMKRLLAEGYGNIYSLGKVFRNAESTSRMHNPEFTMLEWYTVGSDYLGEADLASELLAWLAKRLPTADGTSTVGAPPQRMTVAESLHRYAGLPRDVFERPRTLREAAARLGMSVGRDETDEDLYQRILLTHVEPSLPTDHPVILTDYPVFVPTLARRRGSTAERWELYLDGMEVANCYTEERDRGALEEFLDREAGRKADALVPHPPATELLEFSQAPECSGAALGVDRLVMALLQLRDIQGVIFFP